MEIACFTESGLEEITLPRSLKEIGGNAFEECHGLRTIYVEDGCEATLSCAQMPPSTRVELATEIEIGGVPLSELRKRRELVIPEGCERIGNHWFYGSDV